jgi:hypothetical protein
VAKKNSNFCVGEIWQLYAEKRNIYSLSRILAKFRTKNETLPAKKTEADFVNSR